MGLRLPAGDAITDIVGSADPLEAQAGAEIPSLRSILDGYYHENGGRLEHAKLRSYRIIGHIDRDGEKARLWIFRKHPDRFRIVRSDNQGRFVLAYDGSVFWRGLQREGQLVAVELVEDFDPLVLSFESGFHSPLLTARRLSRDFNVLEVVELKGRKTFLLEGTIHDQAKVRVWIDAEHYQEVYFEFTSDDRRVRVEFADHHKVGEFWFAHTIITVSDDGSTYSTIKVEEVTLNPGLFDSFFSPEAIAK